MSPISNEKVRNYFRIGQTNNWNVYKSLEVQLCYEHATDISFSKPNSPALEPNQPPVQWIQEPFSKGWSDWKLKLTFYFHLVRWLRVIGDLPPLTVCLYVVYRDSVHFRRLRKIASVIIILFKSLHSPVRLQQFGFHCKDYHKIRCLRIFRKICR